MGFVQRWLCLLWLLVFVLSGTMTAAAQESLDVPDVTATSVFAFDPETGEVIMALNADERMAIGSTTKVATALVALSFLSTSQEVVIEGFDMVEPGYSAMGLQPGDTLTVDQLLVGLLVVSGGDAANALARTAGYELCSCDDPDAAISAFVEAMNDLAVSLGLANTQFANVAGADDPAAWSSAHDVAILFTELASQPLLEEMAGLPSYSFTSVGVEQTLYEGLSTNQLIGQYNLTSAKTGSEVNAGGCIVFERDAATGGGSMIIAVLGSDLEYDETWTPVVDARWNDATAVINAIDAGWDPERQFLVAEPTSAPVVVQAEALNVEPDEPQAQLVVASPPSDSSSTDEKSVLAGTVAIGVLALAGVVSWLRSAQASRLD